MEPDGPFEVRPWMVGGGVAVLVVAYLWFKNRKANSSAQSNTASAYGLPATGTGVLQPIVIGSGGPAGGTSSLGSSTGSSTGGTPVPAGNGAVSNWAGESIVGSGYTAPTGGQNSPLTSSSGGSYQYIGTPAQAQSILANGGQVYYQPLPGDFVGTTALGTLSPGTPLFGLL